MDPSIRKRYDMAPAWKGQSVVEEYRGHDVDWWVRKVALYNELTRSSISVALIDRYFTMHHAVQFYKHHLTRQMDMVLEYFETQEGLSNADRT